MLRVWPVLDTGLGNSSYLAEVGGGERTSTVGREKTANPLLAGVGGVAALCGGPGDWAQATGESLEPG
jgi:hypothetical protein